MSSKYKKLSKKNKDSVLDTIKKAFENEKGLVFAYVFGSIVDNDLIRDVDIAVYFKKEVNNTLGRSLSLGGKLEKEIGFSLPVDVVVLNEAPIYFKYRVLRTGKLIIDNNLVVRADFQEDVVKEYMDIKPFRERALKEVLTT